jgi:tripartite-type tricarboxylate transporter receptor subunit TctC
MRHPLATASGLAITTASALTLAFAAPAAAQSSDYYAGKTLKVIVGLEAGGTVDSAARAFAVYLRKHLPGQPTILVQNMPGAGGASATNFLAERAAPDGLTILHGPWDPLAQALGDQALRARYENFEYLGGTGDIRVVYMRTDAVPGGMTKPSDIIKAENLILGALNHTDHSGLLPHLALDVLGIRHKTIVGYRGGADVFLAMQRGEVQVHSTSISTFRSRNAAFIRSGQGAGISYLVPVDRNGAYEKNAAITDMPAFPELYREVHGSMPSGPTWDALNWLTAQVGELTYVGFAPRGTAAAALAPLRKAFESASHDPDFIKEMVARNGLAPSFIGVERGEAVFRSLAGVSPEVLSTLRASIGANK